MVVVELLMATIMLMVEQQILAVEAVELTMLVAQELAEQEVLELL